MSKRLDWKAIGEYAKTHTVREAAKKFGFSKGAWSKAVQEGRASSIKRPARSYDVVMVENSTYSRGNLKARLIRDKIIKNECSKCGQPPIWQGKPLTLILDHINGVNNDHRRDNLRLLCPNCNSQTSTFAGRNVKKPIYSQQM